MGDTKVSGAEDATQNNLLSGEEYLESLRDGRRVHLYGEAVKDVVDHPAFRNSARSVVRLYDALHAPETRDMLTGVDAFGNRTHKFFKPSYSATELLEARGAISAWARLSYGFMGRTPDYKAAFMATLRPASLRWTMSRRSWRVVGLGIRVALLGSLVA